ncbi:MAG TPA: Uma2 family endonuclease [Nostocaceae cyanobacterium]|nr:Uma2 family endonuclease [Nostocaceae cyanobacterium]
MDTITLNVPPSVGLTDEQFYQLCIANEAWRLELSSEGELIIMPPTGGESGIRNSDINIELGLWNRQTKLGKVFASSTEFKLPSGAYRSPDAAWIKLERWEALTKEQKRRFPPIAPDFVIELRSETDSLKELHKKMREYQLNGVRLAWLIDPKTPLVEIYRQGKDIEILKFSVDNPPQLSGEDVLPGFVLDLTLIFNI